MSPAAPLNADAVPDELADRPQWLMWDNSADTPRRPHWRGDFSISWSDPDDWHTFSEAVEAAQERDSWGIGYVTAIENDDYARGLYGCLDLDGAVYYSDDKGRVTPHDWLPSLQAFIDDGGYIEVSPSGEGLHVWTVGHTPPEWWSDSHFSAEEHEGVEFLTNKFVTVTGQTLDETYDAVAETDPTEFLYQAYTEINGENPRPETVETTTNGGEREWSQDEIESALEHVSSSCEYAKWRDIGFAIHDWDAGQTGKSVFEQWSRGSGWDDDSQRHIDNIWSSAEQGGRVSIGTLIYHAKQGGWSPSPASGPPADESSTTDDGDADGDTDGDSDRLGLDPISVLKLAVEDPMHPADYDDDGNFDVFPRDLRSNERGNYVWMLAKRTGNDDVLARRHGPLLAYQRETSTWENDDDQRLRQLAKQSLGSAFSSGVVDEVEANIRAERDRVKDPDDLGAPDGTIMTPSGLLHLRDRNIEPGKREHYAVCNLPHEPDWSATCDRWEQFIAESIETEHERKKFQEYCGYCLWRHAQDFGKAMLLVGPTDSGKSTALKTIRHVLGEDNVASESLQNLIDTRWGKAQLVGNIANVREEVTPSGLESVEAFKELTGGEGKVTAEFKGQKKFDFVVTQKFMFATNEVPSVADADQAFYNRLLFVRFPNTVDPEDQDPDLDDKLQAEAQGILNWMLDGLDRLLDQKAFTGERAINDKKELCDAFGGILDRFTHNALMITGSEDDVVAKSDLHDLAHRYADDIDKEPDWSKQSGFTSEISQTRGIGQTQRRINGEVTDVLTGLRVKPEIVYRYDMDIAAKTGDVDDTDPTGLRHYQENDVRPGYDSTEERNVPPMVVKTVLEHDEPKGTPHDYLVGELESQGVPTDDAEHAIKKCLQRGDIHEPESDLYRTT